MNLLGGKFSYQDAQVMETNILVGVFPRWINLKRAPTPEPDEDGNILSDGAGGILPAGEKVPIGLQKLYFETASPIAHVARNASFAENVNKGQRVLTSHVLVGPPGANMEQDDEFTVGTTTYIILYIHPDKSYQVKAEVEAISTPIR